MLTALFIKAAFLGLSSVPLSDTVAVDSWTVYYNNKVIRKFLIYERDIVPITVSKVKKTDSLYISYTNVVPCIKCGLSIIVEPEKGHVLETSTQKNTQNRFAFSLANLIESRKKKKYDYYDVFYVKSSPDFETTKTLLFWIELK